MVAVVAVTVVVAIVGSVLLVNALAGPTATGPDGVILDPDGSAGPSDPNATPTPIPTPRPIPGHEVYGFLPYWEMDDAIPAHVRDTKLTTLALFSVTNKRNGTLDTGQNGYKRITGPIGRQLIRDAHDRKSRVELVYTSFGFERNQRFFGGKVATQDKVIAALAAFADEIGVDGINVDVEQLDAEFVPAYGAFVARLRTALREDQAKAEVSVATTANVGGAAMAVAAAAAGADRIFMMGYDYHWPGSAPGASSPLDRRDGDERDLLWSLDLYEMLGVPVDRTLLGLPLYGMRWKVTGPELGAPQTARGEAWFPSNNVAFLRDPASAPTRDPIEVVEVYTYRTDGGDDGGDPPSASPSLGPEGSPVVGDWEAVYVDSPDTLAQKLALADARGLAGAGFWAIGYERGLPDYTKLIERFSEGKLDPAGG
jgi:spore germination protein YaaH